MDKGVYNHVLKLRADEKQTVTPRQVGTLRGSAVTIISESGLYKLAMRADGPRAKPFQDWVTREVLPEIRRTGSYRGQQAWSLKVEGPNPAAVEGYADAAPAIPAAVEGYGPVAQAIRALEARVAQAVQDFERAKRDLDTCTAALHALRLVPAA